MTNSFGSGHLWRGLPKDQSALLKVGRQVIIEGDSRLVIQGLKSRSFQCIVTSPPYWGVRDYDMDGQIGMEESLDDYLDDLLDIFANLKRVLRNDGVMWLNLGDVYSSGNRSYRAPDTKYRQRALSKRPGTPVGLKAKDLVGIPWRIALALQDQGWYLRTEIIWHKTNAMPESVRDRPSRRHEYLFLLSKCMNYKFHKAELPPGNVWSIPQFGSRVAGHHAVFPERLISPCIQASTDPGDVVLDPFCGTGTVGTICKKSCRNFIGIELNPTFALAASREIRLASEHPTIK
jgi:site-specific DNA-methyltransferase (adenine-specific)